jgi:hypothetical protein
MSSSEIGFFVIGTGGVAQFLGLRWIERRGPIPYHPPSQADREVMRSTVLHLLVPIGTIVILAIAVKVFHLPPRPVWGFGLGLFFILQGLLRPSWSWASRDLEMFYPMAPATMLIYGTVSVLFGLGVL